MKSALQAEKNFLQERGEYIIRTAKKVTVRNSRHPLMRAAAVLAAALPTATTV